MNEGDQDEMLPGTEAKFLQLRQLSAAIIHLTIDDFAQKWTNKSEQPRVNIPGCLLSKLLTQVAFSLSVQDCLRPVYASGEPSLTPVSDSGDNMPGLCLWRLSGWCCRGADERWCLTCVSGLLYQTTKLVKFKRTPLYEKSSNLQQLNPLLSYVTLTSDLVSGRQPLVLSCVWVRFECSRCVCFRSVDEKQQTLKLHVSPCLKLQMYCAGAELIFRITLVFSNPHVDRLPSAAPWKHRAAFKELLKQWWYAHSCMIYKVVTTVTEGNFLVFPTDWHCICGAWKKGRPSLLK